MSYEDLVRSLQLESTGRTSCPYNISRDLMEDIGEFANRVQDVYINLSNEISRLCSLCASQSIQLEKLSDECRSVQVSNTYFSHVNCVVEVVNS